MLIVCPNCASEYTLAPDRIGASGRQVRCAMCGESWFVHPDKLRATASNMTTEWDGGERRSMIPSEGSSPARRRGAPSSTAPALAEAAKKANSGKSWPTWLPAGLAAATLILLAAGCVFRDSVVRQWPESAALFVGLGLPTNLVGLDIAGVSSGITDEGGSRVLLIEGEIRSASTHPVSVPHLEFAVEGAEGDVLYRWSTRPPVTRVAPGETTRFTARLASPPPAGRRILVSFRGDRDAPSIALR